MSERRHEVTRLEGFSDAVFGFALTLLVVSLEVPRTVADLMKQMRGFVGFALMFAMVCWIWYEHNKFFRRYGLQDALTVFLNAILLFVVLFYVYPLKFLTGALMQAFFGFDTGPRFETEQDGSQLMMLYDLGVIAIFGVFVLLYQRAWWLRTRLALSRTDEIALWSSRRGHLISAAIGVLSLSVVLVRPQDSGIAGMLFGLMGPLHAWNGYITGKALHVERRRDLVGA